MEGERQIEKDDAIRLIEFMESCAEEYAKHQDYSSANNVARSLRTAAGLLRKEIDKHGCLPREWMLKAAVDIALAACRKS